MKITVLLLLILLHFSIIAQNNHNSEPPIEKRLVDLKEKVNFKALSVKDLDKVREIRKIYDHSNLDSALHYASMEVELVKETENPNDFAHARLIKATLFWKLQQTDAAHELLLENIKDKEVISDTILARSLFRIAKVEIQKQMPSESIEHVIEASKIYQSLNDSVYAAACFSHIAGIYTFVLIEAEKALPYFEKALAHNGSKDPQNAIRIYINYSSAFVAMSEFEKARIKIRRAEKIAKTSNNSIFLPSIYAQFAYINYDDKQYEKSLEYAVLGDKQIKEIPNFDRGTRDKLNWYLALNNKELGNYREALVYFEIVKTSPYLDPWEVQTNLIEIYKETGAFEQAFLMQEKLIAAKDSIDELTRFEKIKEITERYENEKKQQEIVTLNAEKELKDSEIRTQQFVIYGTISFFIILIIIGIFWFRTRAKLRETTLSLERTELQQRFLRTQLNPHFFFHALTSIETYIYKNDKIESARFLRNFSLLMRNILESSDVDFISLRQDIDFITKYVELQQLNHEFKFDCEISVAPELNLDEVSIPPMLIQPAVENAILHGALSVEDGKIWIEYSSVDGQLQILIRDNGKTKDQAKPSANRLNRSMSLDITQTRISNFEEVHGVSIVYHPFDSIKDEGDSQVSFQLPLSI